MWLLAFAAAAAADTPLCRDLALAAQEGASTRDLAARVAVAEQVTAEDVACLEAAEVPARVRRKAQRRLVRADGLDALPTGPVDVWAVLPSGQLATMATTAVSALGLGGALEGLVTENARAALAAQGVAGDVAYVTIRLEAPVTGATWEGGAEQAAVVPAGEHYALHIRIHDAVAAARAVKGDLVVGLGARLGMDIADAVRAQVRQQVWTQLDAYGIASVIVER